MLFQATFLASLATYAAAHATFQELWVNGVDQGSFCVRLPQSNNPVTSVTTDDIACNANAQSSSGLCSVNPGDSVTVEMHQQPGDRSCANEAIEFMIFCLLESQIYLAKVPDATTAVGSSSSWFKITEMGLPSSDPDYWATEVLNDNCGHFTFTIPLVIALHVASSVGGAQFYMSCFQINVGGSGTANPPTVNFPGAYAATDPGILINIYQSLSAYNIPGPTPYASASPTPSTGSSSSTSSGSSSTSHTTTSSAPAATQTLYGQCGGQGWSGATACPSGASCKSSSAYYSQVCFTSPPLLMVPDKIKHSAYPLKWPRAFKR
ncbi:glycosyl hydrolase family 61-domain-containing protein [Gloeopeniophorella convolvens]|nr:glycosyl hydrolase family 61-domain-containing protein [Gloeopeniophorella convolvens]